MTSIERGNGDPAHQSAPALKVPIGRSSRGIERFG